MEREVDARIAQVWIVERLESIESVGVNLRGAVSAKQSATEINTDLRNDGVAFLVFHGGQFYAGNKVLLAIGA